MIGVIIHLGIPLTARDTISHVRGALQEMAQMGRSYLGATELRRI